MKLRLYGDKNTHHDSTTIDVQIDENGKVIAVWFRCLQVAFTQSTIKDRTYKEALMESPKARVFAVKVEDNG